MQTEKQGQQVKLLHLYVHRQLSPLLIPAIHCFGSLRFLLRIQSAPAFRSISNNKWLRHQTGQPDPGNQPGFCEFFFDQHLKGHLHFQLPEGQIFPVHRLCDTTESRDTNEQIMGDYRLTTVHPSIGRLHSDGRTFLTISHKPGALRREHAYFLLSAQADQAQHHDLFSAHRRGLSVKPFALPHPAEHWPIYVVRHPVCPWQFQILPGFLQRRVYFYPMREPSGNWIQPPCDRHCFVVQHPTTPRLHLIQDWFQPRSGSTVLQTRGCWPPEMPGPAGFGRFDVAETPSEPPVDMIWLAWNPLVPA